MTIAAGRSPRLSRACANMMRCSGGGFGGGPESSAFLADDDAGASSSSKTELDKAFDGPDRELTDLRYAV